MAELIASGRLDEAAADLREVAQRIAAEARRLERQAEHLRWRGRGADRFQAGWRHRHATLERAVDELRRAAAACAAAADEVRQERRDLARLERAYHDLVEAGALPCPRPAAPPHGDTLWREFFGQTVGGLV
jgi:uncharacterized protein YukE